MDLLSSNELGADRNGCLTYVHLGDVREEAGTCYACMQAKHAGQKCHGHEMRSSEQCTLVVCQTAVLWPVSRPPAALLLHGSGHSRKTIAEGEGVSAKGSKGVERAAGFRCRLIHCVCMRVRY